MQLCDGVLTLGLLFEGLEGLEAYLSALNRAKVNNRAFLPLLLNQRLLQADFFAGLDEKVSIGLW